MIGAPAFRILVVDDEPEIVRDLVDLLEENGFAAQGTTSGEEALRICAATPPELILSDLRMPPPDGMAILRWTRENRPDIPVVILTALADPALAREAIQGGALDYVTKPWNTFELLLKLRRLQERWDLLEQRDRLLLWIGQLSGQPSGDGDDASELVGRSPRMRELLDLVRRVAPSDATVLLRGESGTGKSLLAGLIHRRSPRAEHPFLRINCGAIPEHLLESELFGHEKGAFTGAIRRKPGLFEVAQRGSLLLDEIGDMTPGVQVKLLQAIEEKTFLRVGGTEPIRSDVRLLAATHQDLEEAIKRGDFREDLYYRLNVFPIVVPPLRERREDIPALVEHFLSQRGVEMSRVGAQAMRLLEAHDYPGNIRELENLLERAVILAGGQELTPTHFPALQPDPMAGQRVAAELPPEGISLEAVEKDYIVAALARAGGNKSKAAQLLGMTRRTLYSRMERHGIPI